MLNFSEYFTYWGEQGVATPCYARHAQTVSRALKNSTEFEVIE
jgi:hypothetical protein